MAPNTYATPTPTERERIYESLRCPICRGICLPPVQQCFNGHVVCNVCVRSLEAPIACPTCRQSGPLGRCLVADHILAIMNPVVPCGFNCGRAMPLEEHPRHRVACERRPLHCPNNECRSVFDDGPALVTHFRLNHLYRGGDDERARTSVTIFITDEPLPDHPQLKWRLKNARLFDTTMLNSFGQTFFAVVHSADTEGSKLRIWVGCANPAACHKYSFKFCAVCEGKRLTLENTTDSMRVPRGEAEDVGLVMEAAALREFQIGGRIFCQIAVQDKKAERNGI